MTQILSAIILIFLLWGRTLAKKSPSRHAMVMTAVIFSDFTLIGYLALNKDVLTKVNASMPVLLFVHISFAFIVVALYIWALKEGFSLLRSRHPQGLQRMRWIDRSVVPLRIAILLTSLWLAYSRSGQ